MTCFEHETRDSESFFLVRARVHLCLRVATCVVQFALSHADEKQLCGRFSTLPGFNVVSFLASMVWCLNEGRDAVSVKRACAGTQFEHFVLGCSRQTWNGGKAHALWDLGVSQNLCVQVADWTIDECHSHSEAWMLWHETATLSRRRGACPLQTCTLSYRDIHRSPEHSEACTA